MYCSVDGFRKRDLLDLLLQLLGNNNALNIAGLDRGIFYASGRPRRRWNSETAIGADSAGEGT
jgi:hypothetical protein